jgi:hypothetical protein
MNDPPEPQQRVHSPLIGAAGLVSEYKIGNSRHPSGGWLLTQ